MVKFSDEHKEEMAGNFFGQGVHKVKIMSVVFDKTDDDKEYAEITVTDEKGEKEGNARLWFTTDKAIKYSFSTLRGIFTHNTPEDKREAVKAEFNKIDDTKKLEEECQKLIGKECWYTVYKSDRTYTNKAGELKHSYDRNVYGYEPETRKVDTEKDDGKVDASDENDLFPDF